MNKTIAISQVSEQFGITIQLIKQWRDAELIEVRTEDNQETIDEVNLRKIQSILTLTRDLEINLSGVQSILHLSDQIRSLRLALEHAQNRINQYEHLHQFHLQVLQEYTGDCDLEIEIS